ATPALIGLAVGIYGLSQAILQIPFSLLADRFSRKPLVVFGLLAQAFLIKQSGEKIVHDPRLVWNTFDIVEEYKGVAVQSKS
ncbi:MFS transporter, partial [Acinetobacter baumannii]|uniref:MFS transporter n=1 Tax=Acinetobacter baumannii TaxID=470 RepID=UPI00165F55EA